MGLDWVDVVLMSLLETFQLFRETGFSGSFFDFLLNGLFALNGLLAKNPDLLLLKVLSGDESIPGIGTPLTGGCLVGEDFPDIGSALVKEEGFE